MLPGPPFLPQTYLELAHKVSRPFFLSISILTPLPSIQGKHIQPVFKVVKLFFQGAVVNLKGEGLRDSSVSRIRAESPLPAPSYLQSGNGFFLGHRAFDFSLTLVLRFPIHRKEVAPIWQQQKCPVRNTGVGGREGDRKRKNKKANLLPESSASSISSSSKLV